MRLTDQNGPRLQQKNPFRPSDTLNKDIQSEIDRGGEKDWRHDEEEKLGCSDVRPQGVYKGRCSAA